MAVPAALSNTFSAFRHRNFRIWFIGQLISFMGTWMQNTAQGYLIYELTRSEAFLGVVSFVAGIPTWVFSFYAGVVADRIPRRTLLMITQACMMLLAFILAGLIFADLVRPWQIVVMAFILGVVNAFDAPGRQSFVVELVGHEDLTNAIAINAMMFNTSLIFGPTIAGIVYALFGPAWCFFINGVSFISTLTALFFIRVDAQPLRARRIPAVQAFKDGLKYIRSEKLTLTLLISVFIINLVGFGLLPLIPAWAVRVLGGDVRTNSFLISARGVGAVVGALTIAWLSSRKMRGRLYTAASFLLPAAFLAFALARWLPLSLALLALVGFALINLNNNSNAMIQSRVPDELRGRVMAVFTMMLMGGMPIGSLILGVLAQKVGPPLTVILGAAFLAAYALWVLVKRPDVRRMG